VRLVAPVCLFSDSATRRRGEGEKSFLSLRDEDLSPGPHDATDAVLKKWDVEVHDQSQTIAACSQIRNRLGDVNAGDLVDGLQLDHESIIDDEIDSKLTDDLPLEDDVKCNFGVVRDPSARQLVTQGSAVDRFAESGTEVTMHLDGSADEASGQCQELFRRLVQGSFKSLLPSLPFSASNSGSETIPRVEFRVQDSTQRREPPTT
jgi:hypothetical protein